MMWSGFVAGLGFGSELSSDVIGFGGEKENGRRGAARFERFD